MMKKRSPRATAPIAVYRGSNNNGGGNNNNGGSKNNGGNDHNNGGSSNNIGGNNNNMPLSESFSGCPLIVALHLLFHCAKKALLAGCDGVDGVVGVAAGAGAIGSSTRGSGGGISSDSGGADACASGGASGGLPLAPHAAVQSLLRSAWQDQLTVSLLCMVRGRHKTLPPSYHPDTPSDTPCNIPFYPPSDPPINPTLPPFLSSHPPINSLSLSPTKPSSHPPPPH